MTGIDVNGVIRALGNQCLSQVSCNYKQNESGLELPSVEINLVIFNGWSYGTN